ncbi:MAG: hypothetical protein CM1200mP3_08710 [Chloroflexota bacterium]|nr:MAG: hypothetical protein CM1200mP3_08710 [Chloroflexota bacterium]
MARFITRRLISLVIVVFAITLLVFMLSRMTGDPRYLYMSSYTRMTHEDWEAQGRAMGLDKPLIVQYLIWVKEQLRGLWRFRSFQAKFPGPYYQISSRHSPAIRYFICMRDTSWYTPWCIVSCKTDLIMGLFRKKFCTTWASVPPFWIAIVFIWIFSVHLGWLPTSRKGDWTHYIMPVVTLGWLPAAGLLRLTRSSMLEVLDSEYVKLAEQREFPPDQLYGNTP